MGEAKSIFLQANEPRVYKSDDLEPLLVISSPLSPSTCALLVSEFDEYPRLVGAAIFMSLVSKDLSMSSPCPSSEADNDDENNEAASPAPTPDISLLPDESARLFSRIA